MSGAVTSGPVTQTAEATTAAPENFVTPTVRAASRRALFWVCAVVFVLLVTGATAAIVGAGQAGARLDGSNAAPAGAKALIEVLRQHGVAVNTPHTLTELTADVAANPDTAIAVYDESGILDSPRYVELSRLSNTIILIDPAFNALTAIVPEVRAAGEVSGTLTADCAYRPVQQAGTVSATGSGYRVGGDLSGTTRCLGSGDSIYSVIRASTSGQTVTVLGNSDALTNQTIIRNGNAALALGVLGEKSRLEWYLPSEGDVTGASSPQAAIPAWLAPAIQLAFVVALFAALWRGRRLGPLVIERLPVVVRASQTMEGRARLYERASARMRALDALRIGTVTRLATLLGLPSSASLDQVIGAAAAATGIPLAELRELMVDARPSSDSELVRYSDRLLQLESAVRAATRPA